PGSQYTHRVINLAVRIVVEDGLPYRPASWHLWRDHRVFVPFATIQNWVEAGGKKAQARMDTEFLDWALAWRLIIFLQEQCTGEKPGAAEQDIAVLPGAYVVLDAVAVEHDRLLLMGP